MHSNIKKLYLFAALQGFVLFYAFDKVFLLFRELSLTQVIWLDVIYILTILLFEVPSGALSDRWSRKYVLALASTFLVFYITMFAVADSFALFAVGAFIAGVGTAFLSGTNTSLLFDSLKQDNRDDDYEKVLGRYRASEAMTFVVAAAIGGVVGQVYGLEAALWLSLPSIIVSIFVALSITEPTFHRSTDEVRYWQHVSQSLSFLLRRPRFVHYIALLTAVMVCALVIEEHGQIYFSFLGVGALGLGLLGAAGGVLGAIFNSVAFWFKRFRHDVLYGVMLIVFTFGLLSTWLFQSWVGIILLLGSTFAFYIIDVIAMADVNRQLASKIRATSASFFSLVANVLLVPVLLMFGYVSQTYSPAVGFGIIGLLLASYTAVYWVSTVRRISSSGKVMMQ